MTNHFEVLGLAPGARQEEVVAAFDELLADRRARRRRTGDLHAALAILSDPTLRKAHELALLGDAAGDKLVGAKNAAVEAIQEIDLRELASQTREVALKVTVIGSGALASAAELTARGSRAVQRAASHRLTK